MKVNRVELLCVLESVSPGLDSSSLLDRSSCFEFRNSEVRSFNHNLICVCKSPIDLECLVEGQILIDVLSRISDESIDISVVGDELIIKGDSNKCGIRLQHQKVLFDAENENIFEEVDDWAAIPPEFDDLATLVCSCAGKEESEFILSCVSFNSTCIEATDRFQAIRVLVKPGIDRHCLVSASSLSKIIGLGMTKIALSESWLYFSNDDGLQIACRCYLDDFNMDIGSLFEGSGETVVFPTGLSEVVKRAQIFVEGKAMSKVVHVALEEDRVVIRGEGPFGWYEEATTVEYHGKPIRFRISPAMLIELNKLGNECEIDNNRLLVGSDTFLYATGVALEENRDERATTFDDIPF